MNLKIVGANCVVNWDQKLIRDEKRKRRTKLLSFSVLIESFNWVHQESLKVKHHINMSKGLLLIGIQGWIEVIFKRRKMKETQLSLDSKIKLLFDDLGLFEDVDEA